MILPILSCPITIFFCVPFPDLTFVTLLPQDVSQSVSQFTSDLDTTPLEDGSLVSMIWKFGWPVLCAGKRQELKDYLARVKRHAWLE